MAASGMISEARERREEEDAGLPEGTMTVSRTIGEARRQRDGGDAWMEMADAVWITGEREGGKKMPGRNVLAPGTRVSVTQADGGRRTGYVIDGPVESLRAFGEYYRVRERGVRLLANRGRGRPRAIDYVWSGGGVIGLYRRELIDICGDQDTERGKRERDT